MSSVSVNRNISFLVTYGAQRYLLRQRVAVYGTAAQPVGPLDVIIALEGRRRNRHARTRGKDEWETVWRLAEMAHATGRPYVLHSCGKLDQIVDDLLDDVGIDGLHSFMESNQEADARLLGTPVGVVGLGLMGRGIAACLLANQLVEKHNKRLQL